MRFLKIALLGFGLWILYVTIREVGLDAIQDAVSRLGWAWILIVPVYPWVYALNAQGWRYAFPGGPPKIPFHEITAVRLIGETLNAILPATGQLGGEPFKAALLKNRFGVRLSLSYSSLLIVHTTYYVSLNLFIVGAVFFTRRSLPLTDVLRDSLLVFLAVLGSLSLVLVWLLYRGFFDMAYHFALKFKKTHDAEKLERWRGLDRAIRAYYRNERGHFAISVLFNLAAWLVGALEVWVITYALGLPIGWPEAWLIEALIQVIRMVTFFIPASVGAQEGGIVWLFLQLGLSGPAGIALAIVRRVREMIWIAVGLGLWSVYKDERGEETGMLADETGPEPEA